MRDINRVIIHCSDSTWGDADEIRSWHLARGWRDIGYHYVVLNGYRRPSQYQLKDDGVVEDGRPVTMMGAHTRGHNRDSIGVCLVGKNGLYTVRQLVNSVILVTHLLYKFGLTRQNIFGHYHFNQLKTCPDFVIDDFKGFLVY